MFKNSVDMYFTYEITGEISTAAYCLEEKYLEGLTVCRRGAAVKTSSNVIMY